MRRLAWAAGSILLLLVLLAGAAAAAAPRATASAVDPTQIQAVAPANLTAGASTTMTATLLDTATGAAVVGEPLNFTERTTFGWLLLGNATTDARGEARVSYAPAYPGDYSIVVSFAGDSGFAPANATFSFTVTGAASTPPPGLSPDTIVVAIVVLVVGGVWATYGMVAWLVVGIRADRPEPVSRGASAGATESEVRDSMAQEASQESESERNRVVRASTFAGRNAVIVAGLALVLGVVLGIGVGNAVHGAAAPASNTAPAHIYLTVAFNPGTGLDEFFPGNFSVPVGVPVIFTITNYDNGTNLVSTADAQVSGTEGGTESVQLWGQAAQNVTSVDTSTISHTFSVIQGPYSLNVPIPASTDLAHPTVVTFTATFGTTGSFTWRCMTPCDGTAMVTPGFMMGTVTVE